MIVYPLLPYTASPFDPTVFARKMGDLLEKVDVLVVGPGLGRDPVTLEAVRCVLKVARSATVPLVIDADGLFIVESDVELVKGYGRCVLTPNSREFKRLIKALAIADDAEVFDIS